MPKLVELYDLQDGVVLERRALTADEAVKNGRGRYTTNKPSVWPPATPWKEPSAPAARVETTAAAAPETADAGGPPSGDDFTRIKGIGPGVAKRLTQAGITTYAKLAALSPAQVNDIIAFPGKNADTIAKEDWTGQAKAFAG